MFYVPIENIIDKADNSIYKLVILVSRRALEIAEGMPKLIESDANVKCATVALNEVDQGKVRCVSE